MLACGCAWLRSRFAPLTAVAASLLGRCRLRRNAGLCLTRGMRGLWREAPPAPLAIPDDAEPSKACHAWRRDRYQKIVGIHERRGIHWDFSTTYVVLY
jgi:hypothetical protein